MEKINLSKAMGSLYEEAAIKCDIHGVNRVRRKSSEKAFCPICALEKIEEENKRLREEETEKAMNKDKRWLNQRSIVTNREVLKMTFENFKVMDEETKENEEKAIVLARRYLKKATGNAILTGKFGTGKTHLAMAILNRLNEHTDKKLMFVAIDELMMRIKGGFGDNDSPYQEDRIIAEICEADLLVLDDLGTEVGSLNRRSQAGDFSTRILNGILNGRTHKPTIITTNMNSEELEKTYDGRIMSRLMRGVRKEDVLKFAKTPDKRVKIRF